MELLVPLALSTLASAGGPHPPSPPSSWRVKGSNCGGTGCHYSATYSCECVAVTVMSAASAVDIPHLDDVPGLHVRSFRIPSIVSTPDVVVAFAEARQGAYGRGVCRDHEGHDLPSCPPGEHPALEPTDDMGPKTIAYKRSTNGGSSWGTLAFVPGLYQPNWVVGNAAAVYDARSGTIVLHVLNSTLMPAPLNDSMTNTGYTLQVTSSDAGRTWSRPTQLNGFLGRELRGIAPGPGNAIQLQHGPSKGRLVMPGWSTVCHDTESCVNGSLMGELTFAAVYYSDDSAQTWHVGPGAAVPRNLHGPVAEPSVAELSNGSLTLNMRNICSPSSGGELHNQSMCADVGMMAARMSSRSDDGALTFGPAEFVPGLPSPNDQGSILTGHADQPNAVAPLYFSGPYSKTSRSNMSIVASFDDGATWPAQTVVYPQAAKYSCLASLNDSHLALLVERHNGLYSSFDITFFAVKPPSRPGAPTPTPTPPGGGGGKITATCSNVSDCTAELQAAFVSGAGHVHIPMLPGGRAWLVGPLKLKSHQRITLAAGVEILAKKGAFQSKYTGMLSANGVQNLTIEGSAGSTLRMRRADYANASADKGLVYAKSEWRHGITLTGVDGVTIRGLRITETGGDGIEIASCEKGGCAGLANASSNVLVENCQLDHNYRQGISVISAVNLTVRNTTLAYTGVPSKLSGDKPGVDYGTPPMSGVDLEPDITNQGFTNVTFEDCRLTGNRGSGFNIYLRRSDPTSPPLSVTFRRCTIDGATGRGGFDLGAMEPGAATGGAGVLIEDSHVINTTSSGLSVFDKAVDGPPIEVRNTSFVRVGLNTTAVYPCPAAYRKLHKCSADRSVPLHDLALTGGLEPKHPITYAIGGLTLTGVTVVTDRPRAFMLLMTTSSAGFGGGGGVRGDVKVEAANASSCAVQAPVAVAPALKAECVRC